VGREGSERWQGGLLPCRSGGSFLPFLTDAEQGGPCRCSWEAMISGVRAKWEAETG
jgi:hypothetical protein